jgi:hypothetical protein
MYSKVITIFVHLRCKELFLVQRKIIFLRQAIKFTYPIISILTVSFSRLEHIHFKYIRWEIYIKRHTNINFFLPTTKNVFYGHSLVYKHYVYQDVYIKSSRQYFYYKKKTCTQFHFPKWWYLLNKWDWNVNLLIKNDNKNIIAWMKMVDSKRFFRFPVCLFLSGYYLYGFFFSFIVFHNVHEFLFKGKERVHMPISLP